MRSRTHLLAALLILVLGALVFARLTEPDAIVAGAAETTPAAYLDAALDIMQRNSIHRKTIDWPAFRKKAHERIAGAKTIQDVHAPLRAVLKDLGDGHSVLRAPPRPPTPTPSATTASHASAPVAPPKPREPWGEMKGDIAYIFMPTFSGGFSARDTAFADALQRIIAKLDDQGPRGWILDLRENGGGDMWPMMAGIGSLLGEGENGRFLTHGQTSTWWYRDGTAGYDTWSRAAITGKPHTLRVPAPAVAVLTSGKTASSGEAIVVAFKGRPSTRFFGQPTYGQSTANQGYPLSDRATIYLTTGTYVDRTGRVYGKSIAPDEVIAPAPNDSPGDPVLRAAIAWLETRTNASSGLRTD